MSGQVDWHMVMMSRVGVQALPMSPVLGFFFP